MEIEVGVMRPQTKGNWCHLEPGEEMDSPVDLPEGSRFAAILTLV